MKKLPLLLFGASAALLAACDPSMLPLPSAAPGVVGPQAAGPRVGYVRSGDTIYRTMPGSTIADFTQPVRKIQPGEENFPVFFNPNNPDPRQVSLPPVAPPKPAMWTAPAGNTAEGLIRVGDTIYQRGPDGGPDRSKVIARLQPGQASDLSIERR